MKILNPGSVGQPRDKTCGASWMVLNSDKMIFQIVKTKYDHTKIKKQIKKYDKNNIRFLDILINATKIFNNRLSWRFGFFNGKNYQKKL